MRRLIRGVRLLSPSPLSTVSYWVVSLFILVLVTLGLSPSENGRGGTLWGLKLLHQGVTSIEVQNRAFIEMLGHVWTLVALPYAVLFGIRPLLRSYGNDFSLFFRHSHTSRLYVEFIRIVSLLCLVLAVSAPLMAGSIWGMLRPGLAWENALGALCSCVAALLFVSSLVYTLALLGAPAEVAVGVGGITPFIVEGLSHLSQKAGWAASDWLPVGLPYSYLRYDDRSIIVAVVLATIILTVRLGACSCTRWLVGPNAISSVPFGEIRSKARAS